MGEDSESTLNVEAVVALRPSLRSRMKFPMWVIPIKTFLTLSGPPQSHQELMSEGKLVQWQEGMYVIFVSHQWLKSTSADPEGKQLDVLREALANIIHEKISVQSEHLALFSQGLASLPQEDVEKMKDGYIWFDWFSIPGITARSDHEVSSDIKNAVDSISYYVRSSDLFMALVPSLPHAEHGTICDEETWALRGWCRMETAAASLTWCVNQKQKLLMVRSANQVFIMFPSRYMLSGPGLGHFTMESDRVPVKALMEELIDSSVEELLREGPEKRHLARVLKSLRASLLLGLGDVADHSNQTMEEFLRDFCFASAKEPGEKGFGPLMCAALLGNVPLLRSLVEANAGVNSAMSHIEEFTFHPGCTALMAAARHQPNADVQQCLIELRADLHATDGFGSTAASYAAAGGQVANIQLLAKMGADMTSGGIAGASTVHCALFGGQSRVIPTLIECRASLHERFMVGFTPLGLAIMQGSQSACSLLLRHGADINEVMQPNLIAGHMVSSGIWLLYQSGLMPSYGVVDILAMVIGAPPLVLAALTGNAGHIRLLLTARADPKIANRAGFTAMALAERLGHRDVQAALTAPVLE